MEAELVRVEKLRAEVAPFGEMAGAMIVSNPEQYVAAADFLKAVKEAQKKVTGFFAGMKKKTHEAWKTVCSEEAAAMSPLDGAERTLKAKMVTFQSEQERIRREEQRKLQAAADEAARKERERAEREAAKLKTPELREARLEAAAQIIAPVVQVASVTPVVQGQSLRKTWKARVVDVAKVPREWMVVNETALQSFARSTKGAVSVAGVEFYEETSLASASR